MKKVSNTELSNFIYFLFFWVFKALRCTNVGEDQSKYKGK